MFPRRRIANFLLFIYLAFFSLPMILAVYAPTWEMMSSDVTPFVDFMRLETVEISPFAILAVAIVCYRKQLKFQTYIATTLFLWAALTSLFLILSLEIQEMPIHYYRPPIW
jgi:hypothetical protein